MRCYDFQVRSNMLFRLAMALCSSESMPDPPRSASFFASAWSQNIQQNIILIELIYVAQ